jgi:hypothetical protein
VIPPNIWQDNLLTGSTPYVVYPRVNAAQNGEISYGFKITPDELPQVYNTAGVNVFASGDPKKVPVNTAARRLFWAGREQRKLLFDSHWDRGWDWTELRALWNPRP